ncbi:MAG: SDR family oxidoreductase [Candidatus Cloacimonetes bacterium]|nr:SDR family oxidoreductase [Candidatus Cloacimonadota bacterium]
MSNKKPAILITGANGNIGSALAASFAEEGCKLILFCHLTTHRIDKLIKQYESSIKVIKADITNLSELESSLLQINEEPDFFPNALIHTASMRSIDSAPLIETTPELWEKIIETNIIGTYNVLKAIISLFQKNNGAKDFDNWSRIVLLGSDVSRIGLPNGSAYAASKAAISNMTRSLSYELAEHNILINTVSPGPVEIDDTHFTEQYRRFRSKYYDEMLKRTPLKRLANPSDIISLCRFLISRDNKYITGEEFFVTGGKL